MARTKKKEVIHGRQLTRYAHKWKPPAIDVLKINVDASFRSSTENFSLGMVLRNHIGEFMVGRNMCMPSVATVFEAEAIATKKLSHGSR